jgi:ParB/RepB/Spo0J family partition protein
MNSTMMPVSRLVRDPENIRGDRGDLGELSDSMRIHGILVPLLIAPIDSQLYLVLDGNRRLAAARKAKITDVPVAISEMPKRPHKVVLQLVTNCQRADLTAVDRAEAMGQLRKAGMNAAAIARATGLSPATVSYHLQLLKLDVATLEKIRAGVLTASAGHEAVRLTQPGREPAQSKPRDDYGRPRQKRTPRPRPSHFTGAHPLAAAVHARCRAAGHQVTAWYGKVGYGHCWEAEIRANERVGNGAVPGVRFQTAGAPLKGGE